MPAITSAAAFFRAANGKTVIRRQNIKTIEGWPEVVADIRRQLLEQGCRERDIVEDDAGIRWPGAFAMKPKVPAVSRGRFTVRSGDYIFQPEGTDEKWFGDKKGATIDNGRLVKEFPDGRRITFEIEA